MQSAARTDWRNRGVAALALLIPCAAGLGYLALFGAPSSYIHVNAVALAAGSLWAIFGWLPSDLKVSRGLMFALVILLGLPLLVGPEVDGIARWLRLGGFNLHVGMLIIPLIAALSAQDPKLGPIAQVSAMVPALLQPDPASAVALMAAAIGSSLARRDSYLLTVIFFGLLAVGAAAFLRNLPPQQFVERVIPDLVWISPVTAVVLSLALVASLALILRAPGVDKAPRYALVGALAGFTLASLLGDYPSPLIGYGAAAIVGFGLALPAIRKRD